VCMCIFTYMSPHLDVGVYIGRVGTQSLLMGVSVVAYIHTEFTCGCTYLYAFTYIHTESTHVCVYMLTYIHTEFTCVCVYICVYVHRVHMCVCMHLRIWTQRLCVGIYKYVYTHRVPVCVCVFPSRYRYTELTRGYVYISVYSHRVHVCVYIFRVHVCVCVYFRIDTQTSHVGMYVFPYIRTEFMFAFTNLRTYTQGFHVCVSVYM